MTTAPVMAVGASAGGIEALRQIVGGLPPDLPATLVVVLHTPPYGASALPSILERSGPLPAGFAEHGGPIEPGRIVVAPAGHHLIVGMTRFTLNHDPTENGFRPAADATFRSLARNHGRRAVGVVVSGTLDDGTAGLLAVRQRGGRVIVQDPSDALYEGMPRNALSHVDPDYVLPAAKIGPVLAALAEELASEPAVADNPGHGGDEHPEPTPANLDPGATPSGFSCPDCSGVLWETHESGMLRFRCRIGHAWSPNSLVAEQEGSVESALWTAVRALEERAALYDRMRRRARDGGHRITAGHFEERAAEAARSAAVVRRLIAATNAVPLD